MRLTSVSINQTVVMDISTHIDYTQQQLNDWLTFHLMKGNQTLSADNPLVQWIPEEPMLTAFEFPKIEDIKKQM